MSKTIAVVDIGSTSIQLTIAEVSDHRLSILRKEKRIARLADEIESTGHLSQRGVDEIEAALKSFRHIVSAFKIRMNVTATATIRAAKNQATLIQRIRESLGIDIQLLSGADEARLVLSGVLFGHPDFLSQRILAVDVGGGSSELITSLQGQPATIASIPIGALVVHQKWLGFDQPTWSHVRTARRFLRARFSDAVRLSQSVYIDTLVATGGTIQRLVRLVEGRSISADAIDGQSVSLDDLNECIEKLVKARTLAGRAAIPGIDPDRANFILGGALVYAVIMESFQINEWKVSTSALRTGMLTSFC